VALNRPNSRGYAHGAPKHPLQNQLSERDFLTGPQRPDFPRCTTLPAITRRNTTMKAPMFHNKSNFSAALSDQFRISANWRKGQAKRFAHDGRNSEAAKRLLELESQITVQDEVWQHLQPLVSGPACLPAISETNRDVGFRTNPRDFTAWLENLHSNLTRSN
jgi:hypothetical protein